MIPNRSTLLMRLPSVGQTTQTYEIFQKCSFVILLLNAANMIVKIWFFKCSGNVWKCHGKVGCTSQYRHCRNKNVGILRLLKGILLLFPEMDKMNMPYLSQKLPILKDLSQNISINILVWIFRKLYNIRNVKAFNKL